MTTRKNAPEEARISVRIPVGSDLRERLANAVELTGVPATVIILRSVEAALDYIEETGAITFPFTITRQQS